MYQSTEQTLCSPECSLFRSSRASGPHKQWNQICIGMSFVLVVVVLSPVLWVLLSMELRNSRVTAISGYCFLILGVTERIGRGCVFFNFQLSLLIRFPFLLSLLLISIYGPPCLRTQSPSILTFTFKCLGCLSLQKFRQCSENRKFLHLSCGGYKKNCGMWVSKSSCTVAFLFRRVI